MFLTVPRLSFPFSYFVPPDKIFSGTKGVGSHFNVLRCQTRFWRDRARRVSILCFALPNSFSTVHWEAGSVFMFSAPRLIFNGTEGVMSSFRVLRSLTDFLRYQGRRVPF
jgi:hypothetical protein